MTNKEIFKAFANGATSGKNSNGTLFIRGNTIFSYGDHWPMACRTPTGVMVNGDRFSQTTSKQTSQLAGICAVNGLKVDYIKKADIFSHIKA